MPVVNIRMIEGRTQQQKDEIVRRVNAALTDVLGLPPDDIWIVFDDVAAKNWYVGPATAAELRAKGLLEKGR
jgi:4-oxalocrotonate tautomerase